MSSNRSFMRSPSEKKTKPKMLVTLKQQSQTQAEDLRNSQIAMNHIFESQSNISFSTNSNNKFQQQNRPLTNYEPNRPTHNPLKDSQTSFYNHSPASNNSRKRIFHQFNQSISKKEFEYQSIRISDGQGQGNSIFQSSGKQKTQNDQIVSMGSMTQRTGHINSMPENKMANSSQNNSNNPQSKQHFFRAQRKIQTNQSKNNSIQIDSSTLIKQNDQLKKTISKLQNDLKAEKEKNTYQSKDLYKDQMKQKKLKQKVEQLQEKIKPNKGFLNKIIDRRGSQPQNKRLQKQLIETKRRQLSCKKLSNKFIIKKDLMEKKHKQKLKEKENQLMMNLQDMNVNLQYKNKEIKFKTNDNKNLQDQIKNLQQKCKQQEQLTKMIQKRCQEQIGKRYQAQIDSLEKKVSQLSQELSKREQDKQTFANQLLEKLDVYMNTKGK